jgi:hypothetical protein
MKMVMQTTGVYMLYYCIQSGSGTAHSGWIRKSDDTVLARYQWVVCRQLPFVWSSCSSSQQPCYHVICLNVSLS